MTKRPFFGYYLFVGTRFHCFIKFKVVKGHQNRIWEPESNVDNLTTHTASYPPRPAGEAECYFFE